MKIFLDIDGVMVHAIPSKEVHIWADGFYMFEEAAVDALNEFLSEDDEIILSTTHRFRYPVDEWKVMFETRGLDYKISRMNCTTTGDVYSEKLEDILMWIEHLKLQPEEYLIIDDDKRLNDLPPDIKKRLILTSSYSGLKLSDLQYS